MSPAARVLVALARGYKRFLSPLLPPACRFDPTCSVYAADAVTTWGARRGAWMALRRILRCRPGGGSGWDPVPPREPEPLPGQPAPQQTGDAPDAPGRQR